MTLDDMWFLSQLLYDTLITLLSVGAVYIVPLYSWRDVIPPLSNDIEILEREQSLPQALFAELEILPNYSKSTETR